VSNEENNEESNEETFDPALTGNAVDEHAVEAAPPTAPTPHAPRKPRTPSVPQYCAPGKPWPLGATLRDGGLNIAVYSSVANKVEISLFDAAGKRETKRLVLPRRIDGIWHGFVPGVNAGALYGLRIHGPWDPAKGLRCNPRKLMIDPYARAIDRPLKGAAWQYAYAVGAPKADLTADRSDNSALAAKGVVIDPRFDWGDDAPPRTPMEDTVFYEVHVRGFTKQMPEVPEHLRGSYAGLGSAAAIAHLKRLGVTAVELLPIHAFNDDMHLVEQGLSNYWGYSSLCFFAPDPRYNTSTRRGDIDEFRSMVKALHAAGLEVILDVVYNHSCEGNHLGPSISFKGIDHGAYYRLAEDRRYLMDYTGTGNTVDASNPPVLRLIMDSLRYWVQEMHVDGFRFDLASAIARDTHGAFDHRGPFLAAVAQDPVLRHVKMIAEPWDLGDNGYQVGGFPQGWAEWNGKYRDSVRDFWRGTDGSLPEFAARLCGSPDIFGPSQRLPSASVNVVTVHDGFTLQDLVSYNEKHNEANGEDNRDGESHNRSWNCGVEGPTDDVDILALRERQKRNLLTTLFVSRGVPLLLGGDEMGRSQGGNNNAYCQDSAISWFDWGQGEAADTRVARIAQIEFTAALMRLRRELPVLRDNQWLTGQDNSEGRRDIRWYSVWGLAMTQEEWDNPAVRCVAALLDGKFAGDPHPGHSVLLLFNASAEAVEFTLPGEPGADDLDNTEADWLVRIDTAQGHFDERGGRGGPRVAAGAQLALQAYAMVVLTHLADQ